MNMDYIIKYIQVDTFQNNWVWNTTWFLTTTCQFQKESQIGTNNQSNNMPYICQEYQLEFNNKVLHNTHWKKIHQDSHIHYSQPRKGHHNKEWGQNLPMLYFFMLISVILGFKSAYLGLISMGMETTRSIQVTSLISDQSQLSNLHLLGDPHSWCGSLPMSYRD